MPVAFYDTLVSSSKQKSRTIETADYRRMARGYLADARQALESDSRTATRSAALSLRMAMEALVYERAKLFADDLPSDNAWQPAKLMKLMLEIDEHADQGGALSVGIETSLGDAPGEMRFLGVENVLDLKAIKKHYDAFGSYLHVPTLRQISNQQVPDYEKLRTKCVEAADAVEASLSSSVWNVDFKQSAAIECFGCQRTIRRRFRPGGGPRLVTCQDCEWSYQMKETSEGQIHWHPLQTKIVCGTKGCGEPNYLLSKDLKHGTCWRCEACDTPWIIKFGVVKDVEESQG